MTPRPTTKQQRIDEAREAARAARELRERRARLRKVLIPVIASAAVLAVAAIIVAVIAIQPKAAPPSVDGPRNMLSGGIALEGNGGQLIAVKTAAISEGEDPQPTTWPADDTRTHIQTYVDWSCPACQAVEAQYGPQIEAMLRSGEATLEVFPVAILDSRYSTNYSTRAANAAACVADFAPEKFLEVQKAMFAGQATEGTAGLSDSDILAIVHDAGLSDDEVDACIRGTAFQDWIAAQTARITSDEKLMTTSNGRRGFSTPTIVVNGTLWERQSDLAAFLAGTD